MQKAAQLTIRSTPPRRSADRDARPQRTSELRNDLGASLRHSESPIVLRLIRLRDVCYRTGLSRTTIWRLERRGAFPKHRQISSNAVGWIEHEVTEWIESRAAKL
jgi:prophage regulatory protein